MLNSVLLGKNTTIPKQTFWEKTPFNQHKKSNLRLLVFVAAVHPTVALWQSHRIVRPEKPALSSPLHGSLIFSLCSRRQQQQRPRPGSAQQHNDDGKSCGERTRTSLISCVRELSPYRPVERELTPPATKVAGLVETHT